MTLQATVGLGKNVQFLGQTMTAASFTNNLTFNYPTSQIGDLIIAYVVCDNRVVPTANGQWTSLYSNTTGAANIAIGYTALYNNTTANANTAVG